MNRGEMFVWDSSTIHANQGLDPSVGRTQVMGAGRENHPLARLVAYICMAPRVNIQRLKNGDQILKNRKEMVRQGLSGKHSPMVRDEDIRRAIEMNQYHHGGNKNRPTRSGNHKKKKVKRKYPGRVRLIWNTK